MAQSWPMNTVHPKKLLLTKWTAVQPVARQKHFVVTKVIEHETVEAPARPATSALPTRNDAQDETSRKAGARPRGVPANVRIEWIEIEAVFSGKVRRIPWRELRDTSLWRQGWV